MHHPLHACNREDYYYLLKFLQDKTKDEKTGMVLCPAGLIDKRHFRCPIGGEHNIGDTSIMMEFVGEGEPLACGSKHRDGSVKRENLYVFRSSVVTTFAEMCFHFREDHTLWEIDNAYRNMIGKVRQHKLDFSSGQWAVLFSARWSTIRRRPTSNQELKTPRG